MRWAIVIIAGLVLVLGAAQVITSRTDQAERDVEAACKVLHPGQPWGEVEAKLGSAQVQIAKVSARSASLQAYRISRTAFSRTFACTVEVEDGHVRDARFGELPH